MTEPDISIVMPSLNQQRFIGEAIRSVFEQSVDGVELVVCDGGSNDGTQSTLADFALRYPGRLRWSSGPDAGPAQAINRAVRESHARLVGWLNSDDLYVPGAIDRALDALRASPGTVMVYGEGEHVDEQGAPLGRYPTLPPSTPTGMFSEGCFICQPTAFFRRDVFLETGGLDESFRAAFDFEMWMRLFKRYPGGIGFVPELQARSRLHAGAITSRERERVAVEGMTVLHRHLGEAPPEWLMTHFAERGALHPFAGPVTDLRAELRALVDRVSPLVSDAGERALLERLDDDATLRLATPFVFVPVHADGWASPGQEIRLRQPAVPSAAFRLRGRHARPGGGGLELAATAPDGARHEFHVAEGGRFEWIVPITDQRPDARLVYRITTEDGFVPATWEPGSTDVRELAFIVEGVDLL